MRRFLFCFLSIILSIPSFAKDDPVIMTVNGNEIRKSEFEYFLKKNNTYTVLTLKNVKELSELFLNYKLKVQAAIDEGLDKEEEFLNEYNMYRDMLAEDYLVDKDEMERMARSTYEESVASAGPDGFADISIISIDPEVTQLGVKETRAFVDSLYERLKAGENFSQMARKYSTDELSIRGGHYGWVARAELPEVLADITFKMGPGQFSEPIVYEGTVYLIILVNNRRNMGPYEDYRSEIYEWMENELDIINEVKRTRANKYAEQLGWTFRDDSAAVYLKDHLEDIVPSFANISRDYHDGLLVYAISDRNVWKKASSDNEGMKEYFRSNSKKYKFEEPCFKGMVFFCVNEDVFHEVEQAVEGLDVTEWLDTILTFNRDKMNLRIMRGKAENGLFRKGENNYVDKLVFGEGDFEPIGNFPYTNVIGKVITKPETMYDVHADVSSDYQKMLEERWVRKLRKKYKHRIYRKVLRQVIQDNE